MTYRTLWPLLSSSAVAPPLIVMRPPLPPFDHDTTDPDTGAPLPVYTVLREDPPPKADVSWWRGDAWGLTIPGLPIVPGGATSGGARDRVLTYFLDRYDRAAGGGTAWEKQILDLHRSYGYTHISLSPQDSFADGMSEDDYVAMAIRCKRAGLFVHHLMRSKYYTDINLTAAQRHDPRRNRRLIDWIDRIREPTVFPATTTALIAEPDALIERLLREGCLDIETPAWECNCWSPESVRAMIDHDSDLIGTRAKILLHFLPHYISWQANDETPTSFWEQNHGRVDGICYQCDPFWSAGMMAARVTDGLDRLATCQYNNLHDGDGRESNEDTGNLKGFETGNAPGMLVARGYNNGGRRPDGSPL
jgi:hypothetical protein